MMRGVWWFLVLAFGLSWGWWELVIRSGIPVLSWQFSLYAIPGGFAPAIAATVVRKWITREGFSDSGLRLQVRQWRYYLLAWLLPVGIVAMIVAQSILFGIAEPDFTLSHAEIAGVAGRGTAGLSHLGLLIVPQLMATAIVATPLLWGEEFGWRGYLQPRILPGRRSYRDGDHLGLLALPRDSTGLQLSGPPCAGLTAVHSTLHFAGLLL